MKLLLKEIKATEDFQYSESFIKSLHKPGKTTFIRFSDEMPGGELMLTPNISKYRHGHTPIAIYGYPLDNQKIINDLLGQRLDFSHFPIIIVYWVDSNNVVNLQDINLQQLRDLISQMIAIVGKEKITEAISKWYEKNNRIGRSDRLAAKLMSSDISSNINVSDREAPSVFWNIIANFGESSANKTTLLNRLKIKQTDSEGNTVEKKFSTVIDKPAEYSQSLIDPEPIVGTSGSSVQGFTLGSAYIKDYKFYNNPAADKKRKTSNNKQPNSNFLLQKNREFFNKFKSTYLGQRKDISSVVNTNVTFTETSNGYDIALKLPGKTSAIESALSKNSKINKQKLIDGVTYNISDFVNDINGQRAYSPRVNFEDDIRTGSKVEPSSTGDIFKFNIKLPIQLVQAQDVYSLMYFLYLIYTKPSADIENPFSTAANYKKVVTMEAKRAI